MEIIVSAFSVAAFMAIIREICSLTAASRKHLKSLALKLVGTTSSKMLGPRAGIRTATASPSFASDCLPLFAPSPVEAAKGRSVSTTGVHGGWMLSNFV